MVFKALKLDLPVKRYNIWNYVQTLVECQALIVHIIEKLDVVPFLRSYHIW